MHGLSAVIHQPHPAPHGVRNMAACMLGAKGVRAAACLLARLFNSLTEEQKDRYEAFMRAALPKPKIKKVRREREPCSHA